MLGGIRSGKSRWAESALTDNVAKSALTDDVAKSAVADSLGNGAERVRYIATGMPPSDDDEWADRVAAHRDRRSEHWRTVETADVTTQLRNDPQIPTLVDDLGNWLTRTLDDRGWDSTPAAEEIDALAAAVDAFGAPLVLVSPEVGLTVVPSTPAGRRFADELGTLNQRIAACCDRVVLVVAGQPLTVKPAPEA